jgi:hypothetical protein
LCWYTRPQLEGGVDEEGCDSDAAVLTVGLVVQASLASSRGDDTVLKFETLAPV